MPESTESCYTCYYSRGKFEWELICRFNPPAICTNMEIETYSKYRWPRVRMKEWCGRYKQKSYEDNDKVKDIK